jgi:hypothetical protein
MGRQSASVKIGADMPAESFAEGTPEAGLGELNVADLPTVTNGFAGLNRFPETQETAGEQEVIRSQDAAGNIIEKIVSVRTPRVETPAETQARVRSEDTDSYGNVISRF